MSGLGSGSLMMMIWRNGRGGLGLNWLWRTTCLCTIMGAGRLWGMGSMLSVCSMRMRRGSQRNGGMRFRGGGGLRCGRFTRIRRRTRPPRRANVSKRSAGAINALLSLGEGAAERRTRARAEVSYTHPLRKGPHPGPLPEGIGIYALYPLLNKEFSAARRLSSSRS
jgi:hypothetical protein